MAQEIMRGLRSVEEARDKDLFAVKDGKVVQRVTRFDGNGRVSTEWREVPEEMSDEAVLNTAMYYARGEWARPSLA